MQMDVSHHVSDEIQTWCSAGAANALSTPEEIQSQWNKQTNTLCPVKIKVLHLKTEHGTWRDN